MSSTASEIPATAPTPAAAAPRKDTYGQILKSSVLIGGSQVMNVLIGIVRTKITAILLGPGGVGLMGVYSSIADLTRSVAEVGINSSGVRQIAEAVGTGDQKQIARTVFVLRRVSVFLGLIGALILLVFCRPISIKTFDTPDKVGAVALLSLAVFFRL